MKAQEAMEQFSLPRILGEGIYDSSELPKYRHGGVTPERVTDCFELELPLDKRGTIYSNQAIVSQIRALFLSRSQVSGVTRCSPTAVNLYICPVTASFQNSSRRCPISLCCPSPKSRSGCSVNSFCTVRARLMSQIIHKAQTLTRIICSHTVDCSSYSGCSSPKAASKAAPVSAVRRSRRRCGMSTPTSTAS